MYDCTLPYPTPKIPLIPLRERLFQVPEGQGDEDGVFSRWVVVDGWRPAKVVVPPRVEQGLVGCVCQIVGGFSGRFSRPGRPPGSPNRRPRGRSGFTHETCWSRGIPSEFPTGKVGFRTSAR